MWLYSGAEHYTYDKRYIEGYNDSNRDKGETGLDEGMVDFFGERCSCISFLSRP